MIDILADEVEIDRGKDNNMSLTYTFWIPRSVKQFYGQPVKKNVIFQLYKVNVFLKEMYLVKIDFFKGKKDAGFDAIKLSKTTLLTTGAQHFCATYLLQDNKQMKRFKSLAIEQR